MEIEKQNPKEALRDVKKINELLKEIAALASTLLNMVCVIHTPSLRGEKELDIPRPESVGPGIVYDLASISRTLNDAVKTLSEFI